MKKNTILILPLTISIFNKKLRLLETFYNAHYLNCMSNITNSTVVTVNIIIFYNITLELLKSKKWARPQSPQTITSPIHPNPIISYFHFSSYYPYLLFRSVPESQFFFSLSFSLTDILFHFSSKYFSTPGRYSSSVPDLFVVIGLMSTLTPPMVNLSS